MIESLDELHALYGTPTAPATRKTATQIVPVYRRWINRSRFCVLTTVGPEGTDGSPRGDEGPVVTEIDEKTLAMPDWRGNQRLDSLRNIVRDPRVSLMFMIPGCTNVVRINGRATLTADPDMRARFDRKGIQPTSVIVIAIDEIYFQCARALMRSRLWVVGDESQGLPSPGEMLKEMTGGQVGGATYDAEWPERAAKTMW